MLNETQTKMMNLTIETKDKNIGGDIRNAHDDAIKQTNIIDYMDSLRENLPTMTISKGGSHVWIADENGKRAAIVIL